MGSFKSLFLSMASAIILFLIFAVASGAATIVESVYSTQRAWELIYGTTWFGLIQLLLGINLAYNIFHYKLYKLKKLPSFVFHLSFIFILVGAGVTRYFGFEGNIHIRENTQSNVITTQKSYMNFVATSKDKTYEISYPAELSVLERKGFDLKMDLPDSQAELKYLEYIPNASYKFVKSEKGEAVIELVISNGQSKEDVFLRSGERLFISGIAFLFDTQVDPKEQYVLFSLKDGKFSVSSNSDISSFIMSENKKQELKSGNEYEFGGDKLKLYTINDINFAPKFVSTSAQRRLVSSKDGHFDVVVARLDYAGVSKEINIFYSPSRIVPTKTKIGDVEFMVTWGLEEIKLPFSIYLKDFELLRYPGSNSPMSYASEVEVKNSKDEKVLDYRIFMNNVLDYDGYRFFQSSYDTDEGGTILSVNKDPGKIPTYVGYFLLGLGLILNLINPNSRFRKLAHLIDKDSAKKVLVFMCAVLFGIKGINLNADDFLPQISKAHTDKLSTLIVQSFDGRSEPFDTMSKEVLNKIHRSDHIGSLNSNQAVLSILSSPEIWQKEPIIAIGSSKELKDKIGVDPNAKFASFNDFFKFNKDGSSEYKLLRDVEIANRKHPGSRGTFDKDVIKVDERLNVLYMLFVGEFLRIIPKIDDPKNTWYAPSSALMSFDADEGKQVAKMLRDYFIAVNEAVVDKDWSKADKALDEIKAYQKKYGSAIMPSNNKIQTEIFFNKAQIFDRLTLVYLLAGFILLCFVFAKMLLPKANISKIIKFVYWVNIFAFIIHTFGLALRWYIAEHAPWSNAYESMVYIAWALSFSGLVFSNRSPIALALTSILAGITLFVAHLSWLDPQITTLVPVLQSYWLTIHVSVITASYGFLGLCSLLGMFVLILLILQNSKHPNPEISRNILEATRINEMSMILGLSLLTLGNFLGGVWANESWGRYWGWDSKETWALVSILVYAAVLHARFIPKLNNQFVFAVFSMFAYWSIIMTYFGVNFYLAGMHSYAAGDPVPVPNFIWVSIAIMVIISILAYFKRSLCEKL